jgi:hypothetical protein
VPEAPSDDQVRYFIGDWAPADLAEITNELERRGVAFTIDHDNLWVGRHDERLVDMLVESVTEE